MKIHIGSKLSNRYDQEIILIGSAACFRLASDLYLPLCTVCVQRLGDPLESRREDLCIGVRPTNPTTHEKYATFKP